VSSAPSAPRPTTAPKPAPKKKCASGLRAKTNHLRHRHSRLPAADEGSASLTQMATFLLRSSRFASLADFRADDEQEDDKQRNQYYAGGGERRYAACITYCLGVCQGTSEAALPVLAYKAEYGPNRYVLFSEVCRAQLTIISVCATGFFGCERLSRFHQCGSCRVSAAW
jgi:hypothetical protein